MDHAVDLIGNGLCPVSYTHLDTAQQLLYIEIFCERRCVNMEKYAKAQMEVIEFENEDVITASGTCTRCV